MHYATIVAVEAEPNIFDEAFAAIAEENVRALESIMEQEPESRSVLEMIREENRLRSTAFSNCMAEEVCSLLERYYCNTDDPEYLEFCDQTDEYLKEYENGTIDLIQFPNGRIYTEGTCPFWHHYQIIDGKVYEKGWGPLKHLKRTKRCRRMRARLDVPLKEYYKTLADFVEAEYGDLYDEERKAYGYYFNPDGYFDWYQIGGRWPDTFLVKKECEEYGVADRSFLCDGKERQAPEGYRWACAARKKDIEWEAMQEWAFSSMKKEYLKWKEAFETMTIPEGSHALLKEDGIFRYGELLYKKGETWEEFLERSWRYVDREHPVFVYSYLQDGTWNESERFIYDKEDSRIEEKESFGAEFQAFLDGLSEDAVLVRVDCHM